MNILPLLYNDYVRQLLSTEGLPVSDLSYKKNVQFFGVFSQQNLESLVGIEYFGESGLLRSLVVSRNMRNQGIGKNLVFTAEQWSSREGIKTLYLLTLSAHSYFETLGYQLTDRSSAPPDISSTSEFADLCPASAIFMSKKLHSAPGL